MDIVVIGLGSMGKRRIRLIKELYPEIKLYGIDSRNDRQNEVNEKYGIKTFNSISEVDHHIDCAFVCTSPLSHIAIIKECLNNNWNVFTELNLISEKYDEIITLSKSNSSKVFVSSTFLYRDETKYIISKVRNDEKWNYVYHVGQYLPDWHPWESYKDFFVSDIRTNGCRELLAIELPWLIKAFGDISNISSFSDKISNLNINYDDNYIITLNHGNGNKGVLLVDVVSPVATRDFQAFKDNEYIFWKGTPDTLQEYDKNNKKVVSVNNNIKWEHISNYSDFITEDAYKEEIKAFFNMIDNNLNPEYKMEDEYKLLRVIDSICP